MTNLTTTNQPADFARSPASAATVAEHSDSRWADWQRRGVERDELRQRRMWIVASVIGAGLVGWLLVMAG